MIGESASPGEVLLRSGVFKVVRHFLREGVRYSFVFDIDLTVMEDLTDRYQYANERFAAAIDRLPFVHKIRTEYHQELSKARMGNCACHPRFKAKRWPSMR